MRTSRRLLAAPVAVALLWALAACGGTAPEADAAAPSPEPTAVAEEPTVEEPQTEGVELTTANLVETISAAQKEAGTYDFAMSTAAEGYSMQTSGSVHIVEGTEVALAMVMSSPQTGDMEIRMVDGLLYLNLGEMTQGKFVQVDPQDPSSPFAGLGDITDQVDPTKSMAKSQAGIVGVTKTGEPQQIDGVSAQPYEVVIDLAKLPEEARASFAEAEAAGMTLPATITYVYWMGPDNLIRKLTFELLGTSTEMTFTHWGNGTAVVAPSADQISTEDPFGA